MKFRMVLILLVVFACIFPGCLSPQGAPALQPTDASTTVPIPSTPLPENTAATPPSTPLPIRGELPSVRLSFPFNSSGEAYMVSLALDAPVPPVPDEDCPLASWHEGDEEGLAAYYATTFKDPDQDVLYTPLLSELRRIQRMEGLNSDEYLELMVHFVQAISYDPEAPVCPRSPLQVALDRKGDCDEKSLLLLGLLYREGYDASILLFPAKHHATAGIRIDLSTRPSFRVFDLRGRKYVYIETTRPAFIGLYPDEFEEGEPAIIPTGNGTKTYRAINDVMHIVATQKRMKEKLSWYNDTGTMMLAEIRALEDRLGSGTDYPTREEFDRDYSRYVNLVGQYNQVVREFRNVLEVYLFILGHQDDREGVSGRIANSKVENLL